MKRSLPWVALVLCPFALLALAINDPGISEYFASHAQASPLAEFMLKYWWFLLVLTVLLHAMCFAALAIANRTLPVWRRALWSLAMLLGLPFVVPIYWWLHSEPSALRPTA